METTWIFIFIVSINGIDYLSERDSLSVFMLHLIVIESIVNYLKRKKRLPMVTSP